MFKRNKIQTPAQRIQAANDLTGTALFVFEQAAVSLEIASDDFRAIEADLNAEALAARLQADALEEQAYVSFQRAEQTREQAETIRGLIGTTTGTA